MPTTYPSEFKIKTIRRYEEGESIKALSQELHIFQSTLYQWCKNTALFKCQIVPTLLQNLIQWSGSQKSWSIIWKSSINLAISLAYHRSKKLATLEELYSSG